jgi:hypothetical protein
MDAKPEPAAGEDLSQALFRKVEDKDDDAISTSSSLVEDDAGLIDSTMDLLKRLRFFTDLETGAALTGVIATVIQVSSATSRCTRYRSFRLVSDMLGIPCTWFWNQQSICPSWGRTKLLPQLPLVQ